MNYVRSWLGESDGSISNTRVCVALVICFALGWVTALVTKVHGPVTVAELGGVLQPLGMFVSTICASLYAINKAADVLNNRAGQKPPAQ
jgi:hypothetical protein